MTDPKLIELAARLNERVVHDPFDDRIVQPDSLCQEAAEAILALTEELEELKMIAKESKKNNDYYIGQLETRLATARNDALELAVCYAVAELFDQGPLVQAKVAIAIRNAKTPGPVQPAKSPGHYLTEA